MEHFPEASCVPLASEADDCQQVIPDAPDAAASVSAKSPSKHPRLVSLDVVRGLTMAVMIFVDEIGGAYPTFNHSPWNNITLADFVMPWFLFMVGTSMAISLKKFKLDRQARIEGTRFVATRAAKLFLLGMLLQGGGWIGDYQFGYDLSTLRFCGILQRIAVGFIIAALIELWVPELATSGKPPHLAIFTKHAWKWLAALVFVALHLGLTFGTFVPTWESMWGFDAASGQAVLLKDPFPVICDIRGAVGSPECSATGFYDRLLFGQNHLGMWMSARLPQCSSCSPGGPNQRYRPNCQYLTNEPWCFAYMYDPEGALATVPAVMSVWLGVHFGRALEIEGIGRRAGLIMHWGICATVLIAAGLVVHFTMWPMNKQLWSTSYLLFMAGSCGLALTLFYVAIDVSTTLAGQPPLRQKMLKQLLSPLQFMGMNAILVFFWHGTAETLLNVVFVAGPKVGGGSNSPKYGALFGEDGWFQEHVLGFIEDVHVRQLVYVLLKIACFFVGTWLCYRRGYFWKI